MPFPASSWRNWGRLSLSFLVGGKQADRRPTAHGVARTHTPCISHHISKASATNWLFVRTMLAPRLLHRKTDWRIRGPQRHPLIPPRPKCLFIQPITMAVARLLPIPLPPVGPSRRVARPNSAQRPRVADLVPSTANTFAMLSTLLVAFWIGDVDIVSVFFQSQGTHNLAPADPLDCWNLFLIESVQSNAHHRSDALVAKEEAFAHALKPRHTHSHNTKKIDHGHDGSGWGPPPPVNQSHLSCPFSMHVSTSNVPQISRIIV